MKVKKPEISGPRAKNSTLDVKGLKTKCSCTYF